MTQKFNLGDTVEITGPSTEGDYGKKGHTFRIKQININTDINDERYSSPFFAWYPASSLRLVEEELKVGDYVEVIQDNVSEKGKIFKVLRIDSYPTHYTIQLRDSMCSWWLPKHLRKLSSDEVEKYLARQKGEFTISERLNSLEEYTRDNDVWLSAIEKRLDGVQAQIDKHRTAFNGLSDVSDSRWNENGRRLDNHMTRLVDIEKKLSCQCDREPNQDDIRITITINDVCGHGKSFTCPKAALDWCKRTLEEIGGD